MLAAATALSARGKLLDASRTQRLRKARIRSRSVLGMAAAALSLATAEDDGEDDARAQIAELAETAKGAVDDDAMLVGRRITDAAFYFHRAGVLMRSCSGASSAASSRRPGARAASTCRATIFIRTTRGTRASITVAMMAAGPRASSSTPTSASRPLVACVKKRLPPPPRPPGACCPKTRRRASFHI